MRTLLCDVCNKRKAQPFLIMRDIIEPVHEISNNVVCAASKASDQPARISDQPAITRNLIRAFACRSNILWVLSY